MSRYNRRSKIINNTEQYETDEIFEKTMPMAELDACYALAIVSAQELRLKEDAQRLADEMLDRDLSWPKSIPALIDREPKFFSLGFKAREATEEENILSEEEALLKPLETPAPIDPRESLPSRLNL